MYLWQLGQRDDLITAGTQPSNMMMHTVKYVVKKVPLMSKRKRIGKPITKAKVVTDAIIA